MESSCGGKRDKGDVLRQLGKRYPQLDIGALEVVSQIQAVAKRVSAQITRDLAKYDLTESRFYVLAHLFTNSMSGVSTESPSDIADCLDVTRATMTNLLDGLEDTGYIARAHDTQDRREVAIRLTDKGSSFMDHFLTNHVLPVSGSVAFLSDCERSSLISWLGRINAHFDSPDLL
jgi:DNA-binding MarR family transcriptional regulator